MTKPVHATRIEKAIRPYIIEKASAPQGQVTALVSIMGIIDQGDDVIEKGAYVKTISERAGHIRLLDNHNANSVLDALGKIVQLREIGRAELPPELLAEWPDATGALEATVQFNMKTAEGRGAYDRIVEGDINEWSIAFIALDVGFERRKRPGESASVNCRIIRQVKLYDVSPVLWGMNEATMIIDVKSMAQFAIAPLTMGWQPIEKTYAMAQLEALPDSPLKKMAMEFPLRIFTVYKDSISIVPSAVKEAALLLHDESSALPEGFDRAVLKTAVEAIYEQVNAALKSSDTPDVSFIPPWKNDPANAPKYSDILNVNAKGMGGGESTRLTGDYLCGSIQSALTSEMSRMLQKGCIDFDEYSVLLEKGLSVTRDFRRSMSDDLALRPYEPMSSYYLWETPVKPDAKAGRVLSAANEVRLRNILNEANSILESAGLLDGDDEDSAGTGDDSKNSAVNPSTLEQLNALRVELSAFKN